MGEESPNTIPILLASKASDCKIENPAVVLSLSKDEGGSAYAPVAPELRRDLKIAVMLRVSNFGKNYSG